MANAKVKYILELENKMQLDGIVKKVQDAANGFDGLKSKIEISARSLGLMQRELNTMQGTFTANNARIKELQQALNLASVSATQDEKANAKLRTELDRLTATNDRLSASMERKRISILRASDNLQQLGQSAARTQQFLQSTVVQAPPVQNAFAGIGGSIKNLIAQYASLATVAQVAQWAKEGAAIEQVEAAFGNLAKKAGTSSDQYLAALQRASAGTISNADLMVGANKAVLLAGDRLAKDVPQLLEIARASAKATGQDINFMFDSLVTGLARNSKMIIDNLGITVDVAKAQENYARSIGKTVEKLTEQERAMAFQAEVMRQGKQMIDDVGAASDTNADKIARANAKWENFKNDLKMGAATVIAWVVDDGAMDEEVAQVAAIHEQVKNLNQAVISGQTPWTQYAASMAQTGAAAATLTPYQIAIAQSLVDTGMSAEAAATAVQGTNQALIDEAASAGMSAEAIAQVIAQSQMIAATNPEAVTTVQELTQSFMDGAISSDDYAMAMSALASETEISAGMQTFMAEQVAVLTGLQEYQTMVTLGQADANLILNDTQYENIQLSVEAQLQAEAERQQHELLTDAVLGVASGKYDLSDASLDLAAKFGITQSKAIDLINTFTHLFMVLAQGKAGSFAKGIDIKGLGQSAIDDMISDVENAGRDVGKSVGRATGSGVRRAARPDIYGPKGKGGSGSKGGKSESAKAAEKEQKDLAKAEKSIETARQNHNKKLEDLDRKHSAELIKINVDYIQKALAAEQKFNTDKFAIRNGFKQQLFEIDRDLYDAARAEEVKYWDESQAIAQAGDATKAAELYAAGQELAQMRADHAQQLRDIDAEIANAESEADAAKLADRKQRMEEAYAEEQRLAEENIAKIRSGEDALKSERDQAIKDENDDYAKARTDAEQQFADSLQKIIDGYDAVDEATTRTKDAIVDMVNTLVPEFARLAGAASAVPSGAPASVEAAAGRAVGGNVRAGYAYDVGEFGRERFVPGVSGTILNQRQIDRAMGRTAAPTLATPRQSSSRSETINREEVVLNVTGTAREITQAEATIERIAQRVYNRNAKVTVNRVVTRKLR